MSRNKYHDGDTLDQAFDIYCQTGRQSSELAKLADKLGIEQNDLLQRWGLPVNPAANTVLDDPDYLWSVDALDARL